MQLGWKEWLQSRFNGPSKFKIIGLEYDNDGLHLSAFSESQDGFLTWVAEEHFSQASWEDDLGAWVKEKKAYATPCALLLSTGIYQTKQVDKPNVPDEEIVQTLKWSVPEIFATNEAQIIDYYSMPTQFAHNEKVNLVAAPESLIRSIVQGVTESGLSLKTIGIEELGLCDMVPSSDNSVMIVYQGQQKSLSLLVVRKGKLYFSRRLAGYEELSTVEDFSGHYLVDELSLELQRSNDYLESQLKQPAVKDVYVCVDTHHIDNFCESLNDSIDAAVTPLVPHEVDIDEFRLRPRNITSLAAVLASSEEGA